MNESNAASTLQAPLVLGLLCVLAGCAAGPEVSPPTSPTQVTNEPKHLFVFFDGTGNKAGSETNVRLFYEKITARKEPSVRAIYLPGVGTAQMPISGFLFGFGMEGRILQGYAFLAENYAPGDKIYIFGFSRGAHQARALAGFISYAGLPVLAAGDESHLHRIGNRMLRVVKREKDSKHQADGTWDRWEMGDMPPLEKKMLETAGLKMRTQPAKIDFLGIWDTVPGSSFKSLESPCRFPETGNKLRYKSDPYPPIQNIAHALALDEKRSKFVPMTVCIKKDAMPWASKTHVEQRWFPGAHSDVGGGYRDKNKNGLPSVSMEWMVQRFNAVTTLPHLEKVAADPLGAMHWSIGSFPGNAWSHCEDRHAPAPEDEVDKSAKDLREAGTILVAVKSDEDSQPRQYPLKCVGKSKDLPPR